MLVRLTVRNYAIISELDIHFNNGLTIITGETGAGKSILIGALSLVLGKRADSSALFNQKEKCVVEAHFNVEGKQLQEFFEANDLDYETVAILRREIAVSGKSRAFINDTPVNLVQLRELASNLIDIHSQHELLSLKTNEFRARFIDSCSDGGNLFFEYSGRYQNWLELKRKTDKLKEDLLKAASDEDYLRFQLNELDAANLQSGELAEAQERLTVLENAEEIGRLVSNISETLNGSDNAILDTLRQIDAELRQVSRKYPKASEWQERLHSNLIDLEDLASELDSSASGFEEDPAELQRLQEKVDETLRLMTKHRKQSEDELIAYRDELEAQLNQISNSDEELTLALAELEKAGSELEKMAIQLSEQRVKTSKSLAPAIAAELKQMGMPDALLEIDINRTEVTSLGQDAISIKFTSNKGQQPQDISKIASGGELSRLMLSVKAEMAKTSELPSIIFDEIDTGVSGDVADKVGAKIKDLSSRMQVFCITHLPQIASKANQHLFVFKDESEGKTITNVKELNEEDRVLEIAKMLSTSNPTEEALKHAKNLVFNS